MQKVLISEAGIRVQNAIYLAAGEGKTSFISVNDIAAVAVGALQRSLTGMENEASGRTVMYHLLTEGQMLEGARARGMPEPVVAYLAMLSLGRSRLRLRHSLKRWI